MTPQERAREISRQLLYDSVVLQPATSSFDETVAKMAEYIVGAASLPQAPTRVELEALYREYFLEVREFEEFPMTPNYDNVLDFVQWVMNRSARSVSREA
jgi:hypothetical protein